MKRQTFIVIIYPSGHKHVAPLYPMNLTEQSARVVAEQVANAEGLGVHALRGDRVKFCAVDATTTLQAAAMCITASQFNACKVKGDFTL